MKRRQFIQTSAMAASAAMMLPTFSFPKGIPGLDQGAVGLQLYTLREALKVPSNVKDILKQVSDFGYKKIETFGYNDGLLFGMKSKEFSDVVKGVGMKITSGHYGTGQTNAARKGTLVNDWERAVSDAKEAGQDYMIIAYLDQGERKSLDDYKKVCALINQSAEVCKKYGLSLGYHNHAFEFDKFDNEVPFDTMLKELDPTLVSMEMDLYWIIYAGQDPLQYFSKYPGRFEQWHVKDMDKTDRKRNANVGTGSIDFKSIFAKAPQSGLKNFYIEHDTFSGSPVDSVREGIQNLRKIV